MRKLILLASVAVLQIGIMFEAFAEDEQQAELASGACNDAGTCLWSLRKDGTMIISAGINTETNRPYNNVVMDNYLCDRQNDNRPWKDNIEDIQNIVVGDNITNIGENAFQWAHQLKTVNGMKDVEIIGRDAFVYDNNLINIKLDNVKQIDNFAFGSTGLKSVDMPNATTVGYAAFENTVLLKYAGFDESKLNSFGDDAFRGSGIAECSISNIKGCGSCGNDYVMSGTGCVSDCGEGYLGKEGRCIDSVLGCGAGYRQFENFCNRIRWTPAEAAEVLRNDNTNEVTITFRK